MCVFILQISFRFLGVGELHKGFSTLCLLTQSQGVLIDQTDEQGRTALHAAILLLSTFSSLSSSSSSSSSLSPSSGCSSETGDVTGDVAAGAETVDTVAAVAEAADTVADDVVRGVTRASIRTHLNRGCFWCVSTEKATEEVLSQRSTGVTLLKSAMCFNPYAMFVLLLLFGIPSADY